ncbi:MAG: isoprenyl transferase [Chloroflexi bacterium]|nr:isoprenyl transferase [Chloroflexota bacterium]MCL5952331.1 isoprenyl transferase [Chloroflexota bacterium]
MALDTNALTKIPAHVAIIMDGNGRWARQRGLPRLAGHRAGTENMRRILEGAVEFGVSVLTVYAFSTENWGRPEPEVHGLLEIFKEMVAREVPELNKNGVRLRHLGQLEGIDESLQEQVRQAIALTKDNHRITLNVAFNYGGRAEILDAVRRMIQDHVAPDQVNETLLSSYLYTAGLPDPDLIIRTAGEMRLSNFLIWQSAYAEYYSTPTLWPDFDKQELYQALLAFGQRHRRFGKLENV